MIPIEAKAKKLWDKYNLPPVKRNHVSLVARVAIFLAERISQAINQPIDQKLLLAGALLHDIDKNVPKLSGESHPDAGVRILKEEGVEEVATLVKTHPLHAILDPSVAPKTWEEKILFLADKMVKNEIITVDERFRLWGDEHLPEEAQHVLDASYPKVKALEKEIFDLIKINPDDVAQLA